MTRLLLVLATVSAVVALAARAEGPVVATMDELTFAAPKGKGTAELVDGKAGRAVKFSLDKDARSAFFTGKVRGTAGWDKAAGFSFWVRGDGTAGFGGLQLINDENYAVRYDLCFPVKAVVSATSLHSGGEVEQAYGEVTDHGAGAVRGRDDVQGRFP